MLIIIKAKAKAKRKKKNEKTLQRKGNIQYNKNFIELFTIQIIFLLSYHGCSKTTYAHTDIEPIYVGGTSASISTSNGELLLATPLNEDVIITNLDTNEIIYKIPGDGEVITNLTITLMGPI